MRSPPPRAGRSVVAVTAFLVAFVIVLLLVAHEYLVPTWKVMHDAPPAYRRQLRAVSILLLAVVLFVLFALLMLAFRPGRFFFPRKTGPRVRTTYVDAWAEAGRRLDGGSPDDEPGHSKADVE